MAVRLGHPSETLTALEVLLDPALVEEVLNAYWDANEKEEPCVYTIDMAWKLLSVARETNCLSEEDLAKLDDVRAAMEEHRQGGLTEKNLNIIRAVLTGKVWDQVVQLPLALMAEARLLRHQAPVKAAVTAPDRNRNCYPHVRADPARQPDPDQARRKPDQTRQHLMIPIGWSSHTTM